MDLTTEEILTDAQRAKRDAVKRLLEENGIALHAYVSVATTADGSHAAIIPDYDKLTVRP